MTPDTKVKSTKPSHGLITAPSQQVLHKDNNQCQNDLIKIHALETTATDNLSKGTGSGREVFSALQTNDTSSKGATTGTRRTLQ
mmetsp:Transcript_7496/g.10631  ORF Transcript_7496/g.10631 Transcript_7496/m.10631 type:complete len:84 (+) Transcript_7496:98-349(+)